VADSGLVVGFLPEIDFPTTAKFVLLGVAIAVGVYATIPLRAPLARPRNAALRAAPAVGG